MITKNFATKARHQFPEQSEADASKSRTTPRGPPALPSLFRVSECRIVSTDAPCCKQIDVSIAASRATAVRLWLPLVAVVVSHTKE